MAYQPKVPEYATRGDADTPLIGFTRRTEIALRHAAWRPDGRYIGTFGTRSRARQILAVDAKLQAADR